MVEVGIDPATISEPFAEIVKKSREQNQQTKKPSTTGAIPAMTDRSARPEGRWWGRCGPISMTAIGIFIVFCVPALCAGGVAGNGSGCCMREGSIRACFAGRHVTLGFSKHKGAATCFGSEADPLRVCHINDDYSTNQRAGWTWASRLFGQYPRSQTADETANVDSGSAITDSLRFASTARGGGKGRWDWLRPGRKFHAKRTLEKAVQRAEAKRARATKNSQVKGDEGMVRELPTGLVNQGNTCYLNSLVQTLYHAPGLKEAIFKEVDVKGGARGGNGPTLAGLSSIFRQLDKGGRPASTVSLTQSMGVDPRFQQDAQEFGRLLFMALEEEARGAQEGKSAKEDGGLAERMQQLFGGRLVNYIECVNVPYSKEGEEDFYDLPLDVSGSGTLQKSLDRFTEAELLEGENRWRAGEHGLQDARKGVRFVEFPPVLQFHLKRFEYDPYRDNLAKVNDRFEFPTELDMSPWLSDDAAENCHRSFSEAPLPSHEADAAAEPCVSTLGSESQRSTNSHHCYSLSAIVMHVGGPSAGHYYAYIKEKTMGAKRTNRRKVGRAGVTGDEEAARDAGWIKLDDSRVTEVSEAEVLQDAFGSRGGGGGLQSLFGQGEGGGTASAYMLQYVRDEASPANRKESENTEP